MTQHLVKKCKHCGNVVKIIKENGTIIELEGADRLYFNSYKRCTKVSYKTVLCLGKDMGCYSLMRVSNFKEIIL